MSNAALLGDDIEVWHSPLMYSVDWLGRGTCCIRCGVDVVKSLSRTCLEKAVAVPPGNRSARPGLFVRGPFISSRSRRSSEAAAAVATATTRLVDEGTKTLESKGSCV